MGELAAVSCLELMDFAPTCREPQGRAIGMMKQWRCGLQKKMAPKSTMILSEAWLRGMSSTLRPVSLAYGLEAEPEAMSCRNSETHNY